MASILKAILPCLPINTNNGSIALPTEKAFPQSISEKARLDLTSQNIAQPQLHADDAASRITSILLTATETGPALDIRIQSLVHQAGGWSEYLATKILTCLEAVLKSSTKLSPVMQTAYNKAVEAAKTFEEFEAEHPVATAVFCTVVAIGVLVVFAPEVLEILGFGEFGPIEGSWAAVWQARYAGLVPKGSLFSYLQRLGMVWKHV